MSKKSEPVCACGAPFTSEGVCTVCGKKRPRSAGYRIWHTVWCVIAALILMCCISTTAAMRHALKTNAPVQGLRDSRLSDTHIPFTGKTVTEYIKAEFVTDPAILDTDVASAVDEMHIPAFLADKLSAYYSLLRSDSDTVVTLTADEITALLNDNRASLLTNCMLIIEDSDITALQDSLGGPLGTLSSTVQTVYGSKAGRMLAHFRVSLARIIIDILLLGLLLWRWITVSRNSGRPAYNAVRGMGLTAGIPAAVTFLCVLFTGIGSLFVSDSVTGIHPLTKAIRAPFWGISIAWLLTGAALYGAAYLMRRRSTKAAAEPAPAPAAEPAPVHVRMPRPAAEEPPVRTIRARGTAEMPAPNKPCIACGRLLEAGAKFCIYCGENQTVDAPAEDIPAEKYLHIDLSKTTELPKTDG